MQLIWNFILADTSALQQFVNWENLLYLWKIYDTVIKTIANWKNAALFWAGWEDYFIIIENLLATASKNNNTSISDIECTTYDWKNTDLALCAF